MRNAAQFHARLLEAGAGPQAAEDDLELAAFAVLKPCTPTHAQSFDCAERHPNINRHLKIHAAKIRGCHAGNHGVARIDLEDLPDDVRPAAEASLPEAVADHNGRLGFRGLVTFRRKHPAPHGSNAESREVIGRDEVRRRDLFVTFDARRRGPSYPGDDVRESFGLRGDIGVIGVSEAAPCGGFDTDEPAGILDAEVLDEQGVDDAEESGIGTAGHSEGKDRDSGHAGVPREETEGVAGIVEQRWHRVGCLCPDHTQAAARMFRVAGATRLQS